MNKSTSSNQLFESDSPMAQDDPFRTSIVTPPAIPAQFNTASSSTSSSVVAQVGAINNSNPFSNHPQEFSSFSSPSHRLHSPSNNSSTLDELNSSPSNDSRSILGILNPRPKSFKSTSKNQAFGMLSNNRSLDDNINLPNYNNNSNSSNNNNNNNNNNTQLSSSENLPSVFLPDSNSQVTIAANSQPADGPPQSIMIDIEPNDYRFQPRRGHEAEEDEEDEDNNTEDGSSSPSPSLIRHQNPPQNLSRSPPGLPMNNVRKDRSPDPSESTLQLGRSLLQDHRRSVLIENPRNFIPSSFVERAKAAWKQEKDRYFNNRNRTAYGPIRLSGPDDDGYNGEGDQDHGQDRDQRSGQRVDPASRISSLSSKEMAMWRWVNVDDLDAFLQEVYGYYKGKGIWAIGLTRLSNLLTVGFVIGFSTFLMGCIDYSILRSSKHLEEVIVPRCFTRFSGLTLILVLCFGGFYIWKVLSFSQGIAKLWQMHEFFTELLEVSEADIQTIPWHGLVDKISSLKHQHPSTTASNEARRQNNNNNNFSIQSTQSVLQRKLDAHDVANQIMREKNYMIALFNKDILDLRPPLPNWMIGNPLITEKNLTKSLEWNLSYCLRDYLLDCRGQVKPEFLQQDLKTHLAVGLRKRFAMMALVNAVLAPFLLIYVIMYSFFRYFEEYHQNPSSIGSRSFTRLARWKFRGYNELPHLFEARLIRSYSISKRYIDQFPKTKTSIVAKFISFIAGSFAAVLIVLSIFDPDAFLHFEVTKDRSVLFYIGLFGSILAISRGMIPKIYEEQIENPEVLMQQIVQMTHYLPRHWSGKLHSLEVYNEFGELFQLKLAIFLQELMGVILTPFMLWRGFSDERCEKIIDFFREFTIHVEGIGYVCSFAVFDFNRLMGNESTDPSQNSRQPHTLNNQPSGQAQQLDSPPAQRQQRVQSQDVTKMERSLLNFVAHHPNWEPSNQTASLYLSKAIGYSVADSMFQPASQPQHLAYPYHYLPHLGPMHRPTNAASGFSAVSTGMRSQRGFNPSLSQIRPRQGIHNSMMGIGGVRGGRGGGGSMNAGHLTQSTLQPSMGASSSKRSISAGRGPIRTSMNSPVQRRRVHQNLNFQASSTNNNPDSRKGGVVMGVEAIDEEGDNMPIEDLNRFDNNNNKQKQKQKQEVVVGEDEDGMRSLRGEKERLEEGRGRDFQQNEEDEDDPFKVSGKGKQ